MVAYRRLNGWLHTGDLGFLDKNNNLFIKGRNKTMILTSSGQNVFPEEIEAKLNNMPYVAESLVIQENNSLIALVYVIQENNSLIALVYPEVEVIRNEQISQEQLNEIMEENRQELNTLVAKYEGISIMEENRQELNTLVAKYEGISKIKLMEKEFVKTPKKSIKRFLYQQ